ncbi:hypothetical protein, partial [Klebsiella michiganensis]|uniref:hypothetical protein n=1 Tax=Klebsiella michiganensis TaxID=1134687 RepID=UPI001CC9B1F3
LDMVKPGKSVSGASGSCDEGISLFIQAPANTLGLFSPPLQAPNTVPVNDVINPVLFIAWQCDYILNGAIGFHNNPRFEVFCRVSDQDSDSAVFPHTVNAIIRKALRRDADNGGISAFRPQVGKVCAGVVVVITGVVEFIHPASAAVDEDAAVIQDYSTGMRTAPR